VDKKFLVKIIVIGGLAAIFLIMLIPYLFVATPLHVFMKISGKVAADCGVPNPVISARWNDDERLELIEVRYAAEPAVFSDNAGLTRQMNRVLMSAYEELEKYNAEVERENEAERRNALEREVTGESSAVPRIKTLFRPKNWAVVAERRAGGGCSREEIETRELRYGELRFIVIAQFKEKAARVAQQVKNTSGLDVSVEPVIQSPDGPFGLTMKCANAPSENAAEIFAKAADEVLKKWMLPSAKLQWVEIKPQGGDKGAISGRKPEGAE